jgi:PKD repeat protein
VVGCYTCHNGPNSESTNPNHAPQVADRSASTPRNTSVAIALQATDADGNALTLWIVGQPAHGTVALAGTTATYFPEHDFAGTESFTYAAWDGSTSSNLGTVSVTVIPPACSVDVQGPTSLTGSVGVPVAFAVTVTSTCAGAPAYDWDFGDGSSHSTDAAPTHTYVAAGTYTFHLVVVSGGMSATVSGRVVVVAAPPTYQYFLFVAHSPGYFGSSWTSNLALLNGGSSSADVVLTFHGPQGALPVTKALASGTSVEWVDAVASLFGINGDAQGPVTVISTAPLAINSRVVTPFGGGSMGQSYPAVTATDALEPGVDGLLPQLREDSSFRTNVGLVNASSQDATVSVTLFGADGAQIGQPIGVGVPAGGWVQLPKVFVTAGSSAVELGWARVRVTSTVGKVWAYASVVDNVTGDPTTVIMQRR